MDFGHEPPLYTLLDLTYVIGNIRLIYCIIVNYCKLKQPQEIFIVYTFKMY